MTETHAAPPTTDEPATPASAESREARFARILETKVSQGYEIESQEGTSAVLVTRGARKWLGLGGRRASAREIVAIDDQNKFTSRNPSA